MIRNLKIAFAIALFSSQALLAEQDPGSPSPHVESSDYLGGAAATALLSLLWVGNYLMAADSVALHKGQQDFVVGVAALSFQQAALLQGQPGLEQSQRNFFTMGAFALFDVRRDRSRDKRRLEKERVIDFSLAALFAAASIASIGSWMASDKPKTSADENIRIQIAIGQQGAAFCATFNF